MRIHNIEIENYRGSKKQELSFKNRFTLIIGDNGSGKTSILEALSIGLGGFLVGLDGVPNRNISVDEIHIETTKYGDATVTPEKQFPCSITCEGSLYHSNNIRWGRSIEKKNGRTTRGKASDIINIAKSVQEEITQEKNQDIILPLISYQSAGRLFSQKREKWINPFNKSDLSRFIGYTDCLEAESNIKLFTNWLRKMTLIKIQKNKEIGELEATVSAVEEFMKGLVEEGEEVSIYYDFEVDEVIAQLGNKSIPLRLMSSGYRSVIGMVADLAFRMSLLNPQLRKSTVKETPGVVLIDEIDLHLHPKWQWKIVEDLKRTFPKVQFIATTHAPIVISSCEEGEIIQLSDKDINSSTEAKNTDISLGYGWQVEDVLTNIMGTVSRDQGVQDKINNLKKLYSKKLYGTLEERDIKKMEELELFINNILPESDPAITLIKLEAIGDKAIRGENHAESDKNTD